LNHVKGLPWEYADIPADFVLGATTCALFLSLKYHKLHPEYVYGRIRGLQGKYNLRILLTLVDIEAHEDALKELSKTSLVNNVTIILSWSALEAGRYLELFKTYEHAAPTSIKGHQSTNFVDRLVEFTTVPRSINRTDAIGLVSNFGTVRTAVNAQPEDIALIAGWGDKKVKRWCSAVQEPFRSQNAAKKVLSLDDGVASSTADRRTSNRAGIARRSEHQQSPVLPESHSVPQPPGRHDNVVSIDNDVPSNSRTLNGEQNNGSDNAVAGRKRPADPEMSDGVLAALSKLRQQ
jgi:DNA excision repair protein ERCC-1